MKVSKKKHCIVASVSILMCVIAGLVQADVVDNLDTAKQTKTDSIDALSQRLIVLRGEVEDLSAELTLQREEAKQRIGALLSQRSEVQARAGRETHSQNKLKKMLENNRELARQAGADAGALKPVLLQAITNIEQSIRTGLPFQVLERLAALKSMRDQMNSGVLSEPRAANRLWAFSEDELHLTKENGIYRQAVEIEGKSVLVDVAKLGMVMMYFRAPDKRYGIARRTNDRWQFELTTDEENSKRIAALFESLHKQIRTGVFELPAAI